MANVRHQCAQQMRSINPCQVPQIKKNLHIHEMTLDYGSYNVQSVDESDRLHCAHTIACLLARLVVRSNQNQPKPNQTNP